MESTPVLVVIAPAFNEHGKIGPVVKKILAFSSSESRVRIVPVVVDDGSTDGTALEAEQAGALVIKHQTNHGVGAAIRTGFDYAMKIQCDFTSVISGDDQHNPDELPRLFIPLLEGNVDFVQGSRWMEGGRVENAPTSRTWSTRSYSRILSLATGKRCTDGTNGLRAFRTDLLKRGEINLWQDCLNGYELEPYLLYKVLVLGYRYTEAPITIRYHMQHGGCTKMKPFRDWWRIFRPLLFLRLGLWK